MSRRCEGPARARDDEESIAHAKRALLPGRTGASDVNVLRATRAIGRSTLRRVSTYAPTLRHRASCEASLNRRGTDSIDLYIVPSLRTDHGGRRDVPDARRPGAHRRGPVLVREHASSTSTSCAWTRSSLVLVVHATHTAVSKGNPMPAHIPSVSPRDDRSANNSGCRGAVLAPQQGRP